MADLGSRGQRLWDDLHACRPFHAAELVILEELCRMADRLERLDAVLAGDLDTWVRLEENHAGRKHTVEVVLDDALGEARQLAATFERLAASLKLPEAKIEQKGGIGDLAARRAARHAG